MKRVNYLLVGLLSLSSLIGCSKDDDHNGGLGENGKEIYAAFSIKVGSPGTYATETGDGVESTINNVTVYIFKGTTLEATGSTSTSGGVGTTNVATSLGQKTIFALINSTGITVKAEAGVTSLADFKASLKQVIAYENIAKSGDFLMFGLTNVLLDAKNTNKTELDKTNAIDINVNRISTKVSMVYPDNLPKGTLLGKFSDESFALNQTEVDIDITRELRDSTATAGAPATMNYEPTTIEYVDNGTGHADNNNAADMADDDGTYDHLSKTPIINTTTSEYQLASLTDGDATKFANSLYCLENINTFATTTDIHSGKLTFVIVRVK